MSRSIGSTRVSDAGPPIRARGDPVELARLRRGDESPLGVTRQADPGALLRRHRVEDLGPESRRQPQGLDRRGPARSVDEVAEEPPRVESPDGISIPAIIGPAPRLLAAGRPLRARRGSQHEGDAADQMQTRHIALPPAARLVCDRPDGLMCPAPVRNRARMMNIRVTAARGKPLGTVPGAGGTGDGDRRCCPRRTSGLSPSGADDRPGRWGDRSRRGAGPGRSGAADGPSAHRECPAASPGPATTPERDRRRWDAPGQEAGHRGSSTRPSRPADRAHRGGTNRPATSADSPAGSHPRPPSGSGSPRGASERSRPPPAATSGRRHGPTRRLGDGGIDSPATRPR